MHAAHKRVVILPPIFPIFVCKQFKMFENLERIGIIRGKLKKGWKT